jgi:D-alanyl-lipoteichoic acid acyltransferase DltB (MBOAT superfamily)
LTFNSFAFIVFFLVVYAAYLALRGRHGAQNTLLLAASLFFYGYWNWRFLFLLLGTACIDFTVARAMENTTDAARRRLLVSISIVANLSVLAFFKYFNFFAESFADVLGLFGQVHPFMLRIVLPIGISFYTFQAMGYTIDVYRRVVRAENNLRDFLVFVSFFPQLVAGPISRSGTLLVQVKAPRTIRMAQVDAGLWLLLWGFFKKVVIADNAALIAKPIFDDYAKYHGLDLVVGILAFTVQIYGDFSGYTDIARGLAKLMGFDLMLNFRLPYFARDPSDFWTRWHVSLSSWLRDYLYIPLGGNRKGPVRTYVNLALTMLLAGLWHGAAWNYVLWGGYHGALLIVYRAAGWNADPGQRTRWDPLRILVMFTLVVIGWVLFASRSVGQIVYMLSHVGLATSPETGERALWLSLFSLPLLLVQLQQHRRSDLLAPVGLPLVARASIYAGLFLGLFLFGVRHSIEFIYFQF